MDYQQLQEIRRRKINSFVGLIVFAGWMGWLGFVLGQGPLPARWWEWLILALGAVVLFVVFGGGVLANAWSRGVYEATWYPNAQRVRFELKMIDDHMRQQRSKLQAKVE